MKNVLAILSTAFLLSSCNVWDSAAQQQSKEALIAITVSSRIRSDVNKPSRQKAFAQICVVLRQFIESNNTNMDELSIILYASLKKQMPAKLAASLTNEIVDILVKTAASDTEGKLYKAEQTILNGIVLGIGASNTTTSAPRGSQQQTEQ